MSDEDFRGPIGRADEIAPRIQQAGILLDMKVRYPGIRPQDLPSREAVLVPLDVGFELSEALRSAVIEWRQHYQDRD